MDADVASVESKAEMCGVESVHVYLIQNTSHTYARVAHPDRWESEAREGLVVSRWVNLRC